MTVLSIQDVQSVQLNYLTSFVSTHFAYDMFWYTKGNWQFSLFPFPPVVDTTCPGTPMHRPPFRQAGSFVLRRAGWSIIRRKTGASNSNCSVGHMRAYEVTRGPHYNATIAVPKLTRNSVYILFPAEGIMNYRKINSGRPYVRINQF